MGAARIHLGPLRRSARMPERFTIVVIPDLHVGTGDTAAKLTPIVDYVVARQQRDNIIAVLNVGDGMLSSDAGEQADYAAQVTRVFDAGAFCTEVPGNWNLGSLGTSGTIDSRENTYGIDYMRPDLQRAHPAWINNYLERDIDDPTATHPGVLDSLDNSAAIFQMGDYNFMILWAEFGATVSAMEWLTRIAFRYPRVPKLFMTHSMVGKVLSLTGTISPPWYQVLENPEPVGGSPFSPDAPSNEGLGSTALDGVDMWRRYLVRWPGLIGTVSGHVHIAGSPIQGFLGKDSSGQYTQAFANGDFSDGATGWQVFESCAIQNGRLEKTGANYGTASRTVKEVIRSARYRVRANIASTQGTVKFACGSRFGKVWSGTRETDEWIESTNALSDPIVLADGGSYFSVYMDEDFDGYVDDIRVEVEGQIADGGRDVWHLTCNYQSTSGQVPTVRILDFRPQQGLLYIRSFNAEANAWPIGANEVRTVPQPELAAFAAA